MQVNYQNLNGELIKPQVINLSSEKKHSPSFINSNTIKNACIAARQNKSLRIDKLKHWSNADLPDIIANLPLLNSRQLMDTIISSLEKREPLSIVSLGATEAFVMAQYTIYSEEEFMKDPEAQVANQGMQSGFAHRGIRFPNIAARDDAIEAVSKSDIVGCNTIVDSAWALTERVLSAYKLQPRYIFEANLRRVLMFSQKEKFAAMLAGRRILLIGAQAPLLKQFWEERSNNKPEFKIVGAISIFEYEEINRVKKAIAQYQFDLCLLAAGTNALILAPYIAESFGKVAFDIGWGMQSLITGEIVLDQWLTYLIGIDRIMRM